MLVMRTHCHNPTARKMEVHDFSTRIIFFKSIQREILNYDAKPVYVSNSAYPNILTRKHFSGVAMELFPYLAIRKSSTMWPSEEIYFNCVVYCGQENVRLYAGCVPSAHLWIHVLGRCV